MSEIISLEALELDIDSSELTRLDSEEAISELIIVSVDVALELDIALEFDSLEGVVSPPPIKSQPANTTTVPKSINIFFILITLSLLN
jgi:hypothetical protein